MDFDDEITIQEYERDQKHFPYKTRERLYKSALRKYSNAPISQRVRRRSNVDFKFRLILQEIVGIFEAECPGQINSTGNGRLNGIRYDIVRHRGQPSEGIITIGGFLAPYIVHLGYPQTRKVKPPNKGWIKRAYIRSQKVIGHLDYVLEPPEIDYGIVIIRLTSI